MLTRAHGSGIAITLIGALALCVAGCGEPAAPPASGTSSAATTAQLSVRFVPTPGAAPRAAHVACPGRDAAAQRACRALEEHAVQLTGPPAGQACTKIYGGPERIEVRGTRVCI